MACSIDIPIGQWSRRSFPVGLRCITAANLLAALMMATSCTTAAAPVSDPGKLTGSLMIFWVGEDSFVFYPLKTDPLVYTLPASIAGTIQERTIRPGAIYTDGGSIPRSVRNIAGLSPWGYGPAYIVHDWVFVAHHCIANGLENRHAPRDTQEVEKIRKVDFRTSATILSGVIQALEKQKLVPKRPLAPGAIYTAVDSVVAKRLWNSKDPKSCDPLDAQTIRQIEDRLRPGAEAFGPALPGARPPVLVYQKKF